ncbi:MAG TPA: hypothetical protein VEI03_00750 [Stellaceae bacterium]|nr:hypothetical protein [Stellaceae bacterium]
MKILQRGLALGIIFLAAGEARAQDAGEPARSKGCMTCHAVDQEKKGPSSKSGKGHGKVAAGDVELQQMIAYVLAVQ